MNAPIRRRAKVGLAITATVGLALAASPAVAAYPVATADLTGAVTAAGLEEHLLALQAIAAANGGNRAAGTAGYEASLVYVEGVLQAAGYQTVRQDFSYSYETYEPSELQQVSPDLTTYALFDDFYPMAFSATDGATTTADITVVDVNLVGDRASTSGCETTDFIGFPAGDIALIQRGSCNFSIKADNAAAAGASGVIVFNQGNVDPSDDRFGAFGGTLDAPVRSIPVVSASFALGEELATLDATSPVRIRILVDSNTVTVATANVLADTPTGRTDRKVVVGAHLDSVPEGPGINDNGSGTATLLEIAVQMAELGIEPENQVRFAFWGGEEDGLNGSNYYVSQLSKTELKQHAVNLNFDMLGSPNPVRFVYDGNGDAFGLVGPNGSDVIESVFLNYFGSLGLPSEPTAFDGRSDYFAFINAGIPAGGLFSGAEEPKTAAQAALYGGRVGVAYDPCYHSACDTIGNIDWDDFEIMADAAAHATLVFAETTSAVNGTAKGKAKGQIAWENIGNRAAR